MPPGSSLIPPPKLPPLLPAPAPGSFSAAPLGGKSRRGRGGPGQTPRGAPRTAPRSPSSPPGPSRYRALLGKGTGTAARKCPSQLAERDFSLCVRFKINLIF